MKKTLTLLLLQIFVFIPTIVFAQIGQDLKYNPKSKKDSLGSSGDLGDISSIFDRIITFINSTLIPLVFALALLMFLYGIFKYFILGGGDEGKRAEGKQMMLWSIIGFVVMVSIFGIVNIVSSGLGLDEKDATLNIPKVPER